MPWFLDAVTRADPSGLRECRRLRKKRRCDYWLVFSAPIPDAETMFAIHWHSGSAGPLPSSEAEAVDGQWTATPYRVRSLSRKSLVPRGGGSLDMSRKSILLVGCGSVGSELAMRLTSAGVGRLTVSDYDTFSEHNLYRHVLSVNDIGRFKTEALAREIILRHPWAKVTSWHMRLEELRDPARLQPVRFGGDRDRFADGRTGFRGILSPSSLGRTSDQLLAGGLRNRRPCHPVDSRGERMLALCLRGPQDAHARTNIKPEFPETGTGCDAQPRGLRDTFPALQRDRGKLHGDDGRGLGRALFRG